MKAWEPTDTARTLGNKVGLSRSAVSGYYNRNPELRTTHPLAGKDTGAATKARQARAKGRQPRPKNYGARSSRLAALAAAATVPAVALPPDPVTVGRYTLLALPAGCCKWPYGDDPATMTFCGAQRDGKHPAYCTHHAKRSVKL